MIRSEVYCDRCSIDVAVIRQENRLDRIGSVKVSTNDLVIRTPAYVAIGDVVLCADCYEKFRQWMGKGSALVKGDE